MPLKPPSVYVKDTRTAKGRGVFALRSFGEGEVVEVCPVVLLHAPFDDLPEELQTLVYDWESLAGEPDTFALALGYGSLYNHDNPANLRYEADESGLLLSLTAVRRIDAGEELSVNYNAEGGGTESDDDWWFEGKNIKPIVGP